MESERIKDVIGTSAECEGYGASAATTVDLQDLPPQMLLEVEEEGGVGWGFIID